MNSPLTEDGRVKDLAANQRPTVLIVDDEDSVCTALRQILHKDFTVLCANSANQALSLLNNINDPHSRAIDLVLSDICMSQMNGIDLLRKIKEYNPQVEVIMITGYPSSETTLEALRLGASDYIMKPFKMPQTLESIQRAIDKRKKNKMDEKVIQDLRDAINSNYTATTDALILAIDAKDNYTKQHCDRVADLMGKFAERLGLEQERKEHLVKSARLHDIGKIGIKEQVLNKPGPLDPDEWAQMKQHPVIGFQILQPVEFLGEIRKVLLYHHERFDGKGYPDGLKGPELPLGAKMLAVVDVYDALVSDRPYRKRLTEEDALAELENNAGTQFDSYLAHEFINMIQEK